MKIRHSLVCLLIGFGLMTSSAFAVSAQQEVASGSALLVDLATDKVLYERNADSVVPIASVTKLMTAVVTLDAKLPLNEMLAIDISQTKEMRGVFSRVRIGSELSRHDMLFIALMSSENRAAASLAHHYPGGYSAFIAAMNAKAKALGMNHTHYVEPTGLSERNVSSARDLVRLLKAANKYPLIKQFTTTASKTQAFRKPNYTLGFSNTNHLVRKAGWDVHLSKTGFTNKAGRCLVMNTVMNKREVAFVALDAFGKYTHMADATRLKRWLETGKTTPLPAAAVSYRQQKLASRQSVSEH